MGTMGTINDSRTYPRKLLTTLAVLALLAAQMAGLGAQPAHAAGVWGYITFADEHGTLHTVDITDEDETSGDIAIPGYEWDESEDGLFHISCSQTLLGTTATTTDENPAFDAGIEVKLVDFDITRQPGEGQLQECAPADFYDVDLVKSASADGNEVERGDSFSYEITATTSKVDDEDHRELEGVVITDEVPAPLEIQEPVTYSGDGGSGECNVDDRLVTCEVGDLTSEGDTATVTINVQVPEDADCEPMENTATVSALLIAPVSSNTVIVDIVGCPDPEVPEYFVEFTKDWTGDTDDFDLGDDDVTFTVNGDTVNVGDTYQVELGEQLTLTEEVTTDLGDCTYDSTLPESYDVPSEGDPDGETFTIDVTNDIDCPDPEEPSPDIAIVKTAIDGVQFDDNDNPFVVFEDGNGSHDVTYEYEVTNAGDEDLVDLTLVDDKIDVDLSEDLQAAVGEGPFVAGESVTVTALHEGVTADDFDEGLLTNVATVSGFGPESEETVTDSDDETVFDVDVLGLIPAITVDKTAVDGVSDDGEGNWIVQLAEGETATVTYEFVVSNPSEDALTDLTLEDDKIGVLTEELEQAVIDEHGDPILPPDGSVTVTADYETTTADFDNGSVTNVVDVEGVGETSGVTVSDSDVETVSIVEVQAEVEVAEEAEPEEDVEVAAEVETLPRTGIDSANLLLLGLLFSLLGAAGLLLSPGRRGGPGMIEA